MGCGCHSIATFARQSNGGRPFSAREPESMSDDRLMLTIFIACVIIAAGALVMLFLLVDGHGLTQAAT
jgi:hypothetical protein